MQIIKDIAQPIDGRDLLIVEDILDSGVTLHYLMQILAARGANSIRLCTLLSKPERRKIQVIQVLPRKRRRNGKVHTRRERQAFVRWFHRHRLRESIQKL